MCVDSDHSCHLINHPPRRLSASSGFLYVWRCSFNHDGRVLVAAPGLKLDLQGSFVIKVDELDAALVSVFDEVIPILKDFKGYAISVVNCCLNEVDLGVFIEEMMHKVVVVVRFREVHDIKEDSFKRLCRWVIGRALRDNLMSLTEAACFAVDGG